MKKNFLLLSLAALMCLALPSCEKPDDEKQSQEIPEPPRNEDGVCEILEVDMGGSVLWASCNLGAKNNDPMDPGYYFTWGDINPPVFEHKRSWWMSVYKWAWYCYSEWGLNKYSVQDGKSRLDPEDDAAVQMWGDGWRMPTADELRELLSSDIAWADGGLCGLGQGHWYIMFQNSGSPYHSLILPGGHHSGGSNTVYSEGLYWSSDCVLKEDPVDGNFTAYALYGGPSVTEELRCYGGHIRPCKSKPTQQ